jgi:hypothetical protein
MMLPGHSDDQMKPKASFDSSLEAAQYVFKFGLLVAIGGILTDAIIAHGLFWDNDPYWTYWVTKTVLITTVFTIGTALFGMGIWQGLVITLAHTAILESYYAWFSPVGLPQEPEWLDVNHVWITGPPAHYLAILTGYMAALWIWRRNKLPDLFQPNTDPKEFASVALVTSLLAIVFDGVITHGLVRGQFPGLTYFIQHLIVAFVVSFAWAAFVGFEGVGWIIGAISLAVIWVGYDMYLSPIGLPQHVQYLTYEELWFQALPGGLLASILGFFLAPRAFAVAAHKRIPAVTALLMFLIFMPAIGLSQGLPANASAQGPMKLIVGADPTNMDSSVDGEGSIKVNVVENGNRWSHVQNTDEIQASASFKANGAQWDIVIDRPMPRHPLGHYTTWNGVVFNHEMHGSTGIGTSSIPRVKPDIALWGWATVRKDGKLVSSMSPAHVMVIKSGPMSGVMLDVSSEDKSLLVAPNGYLMAMWPQISSLQMPEKVENGRKAIGWLTLVILPGLFWWLAVRESRARV